MPDSRPLAHLFDQNRERVSHIVTTVSSAAETAAAYQRALAAL